MRHLLFTALLVFGLGAAGQSSKTAASKPAPATSKKTAVPKKSAAKAPAKSSKKRAVARKRTQQQPTPERYSEIQEALIGRGFLQSPATGVWGAESAAALRRFQEDQKLGATGKIDALSLTRLGLGPKKTSTAQAGGIPPAASQKEAQP